MQGAGEMAGGERERESMRACESKRGAERQREGETETE